MTVPFEGIDTVFFDVGNTLISIDFDRVSEELARRGHAARPEAIRRAEARARPELSAARARQRKPESPNEFAIHLDSILSALDAGEGGRLDGARRRELIEELTPAADSHVVGHQKPDPRIFEHALAACDADPARTLHVGDLYAADVVGARAAGVHPVLLDPFDDWGETDCVRLADIGHLGERPIDTRPGKSHSWSRSAGCDASCGAFETAAP